MYLSEATAVVSARSWAQHGGSAALPAVTRVAAVAWWLRVRSRSGPVSGRLAPASSLGGPGGVREVARPLKGQARESWDVTPTALHLWGERRSGGPGPEPTARPDGRKGAGERREGVWPPAAQRFPIRLFLCLSHVLTFLCTSFVYFFGSL